MLPRISSAIAQAIQPIVSSRASNDSEQQRHQSPHDEPSRDEKRPEAPEPAQEELHAGASPPSPVAQAPVAKPVLRLVPEMEQLEESPKEAEKPKAVISSHAGMLFLQLVELIKRGGAPFALLAGGRAYLASIRRQKQSGSFRKGTLLDQKAE